MDPTTELLQRIDAFIGAPASSPDDFNRLALDAFRFQFESVPAYGRWCGSQKVGPDNIARWRQAPALPVAAFKEFEITSLAASERTTIFRSSGTSERERSRHFHSEESLSLYQRSLLPPLKEHFFGGDRAWRILILTPPPEAAPHSSLVHLFETARRRFGSESMFLGHDSGDGWAVDFERTIPALAQAEAEAEPIALFGTAFSYVHLLDELKRRAMRVRLPDGSRALETGGYKGRSRELTKDELHQLIGQELGIARSHIVTEYGMCELSSQAYEGTIGSDERTAFHFPHWCRASVISPETLQEVGEGETGLIEVFDLANLFSVSAVRTEDLGRKRGNGFELLGRAAASPARGCSLLPH